MRLGAAGLSLPGQRFLESEKEQAGPQVQVPPGIPPSRPDEKSREKDGSPDISPRALLPALCVAQFLLPFMMAGVNAALPSIGQDIQAGARDLSLIGTFYALGLAVFQLTSGRMGDVWGRRRVFLMGMGVFIVASLLLGFVNRIEPMLALRSLQGAGAAMFSASGLAILAATAPPGMRGRYVGVSGAAVYAGIACGPPVAGLIAGTIGWRWLFWGNAIVCAAAWGFICLTVRTEWREGKGEPFDWRGGLFYGAGMTALTLGGASLQGSPQAAWALLPAGVGILAVYARLELRTAFPLLDLRLLARNRMFGLSSLAAFVNYASSFGMLFFFSLYLQVVRGMGAAQAGLFLALQSLVQVAAAPLAGRMGDKYGAERISAMGIALCGAGLCASSLLGQETPLWHLNLVQVILGLGLSLFAVPNTTIILESVGPRHLGQAAGLIGAVRTGGALLNMVIISITMGLYLGEAPVGPAVIEPFLDSLRTDLALFGLLNLAAVGCALGRFRLGKH